MKDPLFGELRYEDDGWWGKCTLELGGRSYPVDLWIQGEAEITRRQERAFARFLEKWPALQAPLLEALITYYQKSERFCCGPDDQREAAAWWPEIDTGEALLQAVTPETLVVAEDFMQEAQRCVYLLFSKTWGGGDPNGNGIGVRWIDEELAEIAYQDIAF